MERKVFLVVLVVLFFLNFVLAGPGIKWDSESIVIPEKGSGCLTYKVYNPWPEDSTMSIRLSEEISGLIKTQDKENIFVPAQTSSKEAISVEFCFEVEEVYSKDCWVGGLVCEQRCEQDMIVYEGEVVVSGVSAGGGAGGSATKASVSAPIRVRVKCNSYDRNYTVVYAVLVFVGLVIFYFYFKRRSHDRHKSKTQKSRR